MEPKLYLELLKKCLLNEIYIENEARFLYIFASLITGNPIDSNVVREIGNRLPELVKRIKDARLEGKPWWFVDVKRGDGTFERINLRNLCEFSHTMIGRMRLNNIEQCLDVIRKENIPGDLVETGVWRGGACIFMKGYLKAYEMRGRRVFVCDSFEGLPKPTAPEDEGYDFSKEKMPILAITEQEVRENFLRYDLLDEDVIFVKGWFKDTLNKLPTNQIALLRLDGDLYESTIDALNALYDRVVPGGFIIVDDYGDFEPCRRAVDEFRTNRGINETIHKIDWAGVYWRKSGVIPSVRSFHTTLCRKNLFKIQDATHRYSWRDIPLWKNPFDFANYFRLIWNYRPKTIIEIGTKFGGSAAMFSDILRLYGIDGSVITVDIEPPRDFQYDNVEVIKGDAKKLDEALPESRLKKLPHPWLVVEDSSHKMEDCLAAIEYLDQYMEQGDILVVEDGIILDLGLEEQYNGGPNRAVIEFIRKRAGKYRLLIEYCDFWGENLTWNPNGYWIKVGE